MAHSLTGWMTALSALRVGTIHVTIRVSLLDLITIRRPLIVLEFLNVHAVSARSVCIGPLRLHQILVRLCHNKALHVVSSPVARLRMQTLLQVGLLSAILLLITVREWSRSAAELALNALLAGDLGRLEQFTA